jgi:uncharacterized protein with HEPN domain
VLESTEKIGHFIAGHTAACFCSDELTFDAVLVNLQIFGEAVIRLPDAARAELSVSRSARTARLRDLIAHHYCAIDSDMNWEVATTHVPGLREYARRLRDATECGA